jgi:acetolactate synthase small subunit
VTQGRIVKVIGYYRDPGFLERVISTFRKLWVDIDWVTARRISDDGLYEVYLLVRETKNTHLAILNLSKTVDVEKVEVLEDGKLIPCQNDSFFIPSYTKVTTYSWGEKVG